MQLSWSFKRKSTQQYSHKLPLVQICGSLHLETAVKVLKWPTMWWMCNLLMSHLYIHYPEYLTSFLPEYLCYWQLQRSEFLAFMMLCSAAAMSPVCHKWNICAGLILMKTSWQYAFSPLWDWALVTLLVWDFISCLSETYYTLKMYSKHVSTRDFILSAYLS